MLHHCRWTLLAAAFTVFPASFTLLLESPFCGHAACSWSWFCLHLEHRDWGFAGAMMVFLYSASASGLIHTAYFLPLFLPYTHPGIMIASPSARTMALLFAAAATFSSTYWNLGLRSLAYRMPSSTAFIDSVASWLRRLPAAFPFPHGFPLLKP